MNELLVRMKQSFLGGTLFLLFFLGLMVSNAYASTIHNFKDTISDSGPGVYANHTVEFRTKEAIPAGSYVRFRPEAGQFTIPSSNFDGDNVAFYVDGSLRVSTTTATTTADYVTITTGSSGQIEITLSSLAGIAADADIEIRIGSHTQNSTSTDLGILNPSVTGSHRIYVDTGGATNATGNTLVYIIDKVTVGPIDSTETIPPIRFNGAPSGVLSGTVTKVGMSLETNEFARCRYGTTPGIAYFSMGKEFTTFFTTVHDAAVTVATNTSYTFYVRCIDDEGNANIDDFIISFSIPEYPDGVPGPEGDEEGEGSGTGEGSGASDPGDGAPSGGKDTTGGSSGGGSSGGGGSGGGPSSGGSDGGGGFESTGAAYQSGDARVIINGYAFPNSDVIILVDGVRAETVRTDRTGDFSATLDEIARGTYTFGVYAVDRNGTKSTTFSTTFSVTGSRGSTLSNVNVMPSIVVSPDPVDPGTDVTFSGYSIPDATITIENLSDRSSISLKTFTTTSDSDGAWSYTADTGGFTTGTYKVRAKAVQTGGVSTDFSDYTYYGVGEEADIPLDADLNRDGFINLIDFSILLFWWNSDGGDSDPPADINRDGRVTLTDFSIMIFNWTG